MPVMKTHSVALDMYKTSSDTFEVVEGDTANLIVITLKDRGNPVDLTGCKVVVSFTRGGIPAEQDTDGHGVTISGEHNNIITVDLYSSSYVSGSNIAEVQVWSGEDYSRLATSAWFNFKARRARVNENTLLSVPQFPLLSGMLQTLYNIVRGIQAKWSTTNAEDPSFIQDKPVIGTDIQAPTNALTVDYEPTGTDELPTYRPLTGHRKTTFASVLGYIRTQLDAYFAPLTHASRHASGGSDAITPESIGAASETSLDTAVDDLTTAIAGKANKAVTMMTETSSFTIQEKHFGAVIQCDSASAIVVTIPPSSSLAVPNGTVIVLLRTYTGALRVAAGSGVGLGAPSGILSASVQHAPIVITKRGGDTWSVVCG